MKYFAYGSNMSVSRLRARVPGAVCMGPGMLAKHSLRFHKTGQDGSGKCDAFYTQCRQDTVIGALFEICAQEKTYLDKVEGLGYGYQEKTVWVRDAAGVLVSATTYYAVRIDAALKPYSWYKNHVLVGARELSLPAGYIAAIESIDSLQDPDKARETQQHAIHD